MSEQPRPVSAHEMVPPPANPEEARRMEAASIYMRYISTAMEPFLVGPDYFRQAQTGTHGVTGVNSLTATGEERILRVHTPPDDDGRTREIVYQTRVTSLGYERDRNSSMYVQEGSVHFGAVEASVPRLPEESDLQILSTAFENMVPWPDVRGRVQGEVATMLQPLPQEQ